MEKALTNHYLWGSSYLQPLCSFWLKINCDLWQILMFCEVKVVKLNVHFKFSNHNMHTFVINVICLNFLHSFCFRGSCLILN